MGSPRAIFGAVIAAHPVGRTALHTLLAGACDYAGLFPPAELGMESVLANYLEYRVSADAWALGRLVVPAVRLPELEAAVGKAGTPPPLGELVPLSILIGAGVVEEVALVEAFEERDSGRQTRVESVEVKARTARQVVDVLGDIPSRWHRYIEVPAGSESDRILGAVSFAGARAKVRTGGVTPEVFPSTRALLAFLAAAARRRIAFKATAGLHHALHGTYPLTYEPDPPRGRMFGYLNLALAAAVLWKGGEGSESRAQGALLEDVAGAVDWDESAVQWRGERFDRQFLVGFRKNFFHGFGSCAFREPLDELATMASR